MDILSESESNSFNQFLNAFSSSPGLGGPTHLSNHTGGQSSATGRVAVGAGLQYGSGAAPIGGWAPPGSVGTGTARASSGVGLGGPYRVDGRGSYSVDGAMSSGMSGFGRGAAPFPPPPPLPSLAPLPPYSSVVGAGPFPHSLPPPPIASTSRHSIYSGTSSAAAFLPSQSPFPARPPPLSNFLPPPPSFAAPVKTSLAEDKLVRMAQQAKELEAMMQTAGPSGTAKGKSVVYAGDAGEEEVEAQEELESPPSKRKKSGTSLAEDPLVLLLEAEKRSMGRSTAPRSSISTFAEAQPVFAPPPTRLSAGPLYPPSPIHADEPAPAPKKRKAPARSGGGKVKAKPPPSPVKAEDGDDDLDLSSAQLNPAPLPTPTNIPLAPPRPARPRPSSSTTRKRTSSSSSPPAPAIANAKVSRLLTDEEKKANHIASEQKRRAAIRAGYDGLCAVVPALKAAVDEYEQRVSAISQQHSSRGRGKKAAGRGKAGESITGALMGGIEVGGEKVDGRAGPKSEAVVLSKTVEHLRALLSDRAYLLNRLSSAHSTASSHSLDLPPPPPASGLTRSSLVAGAWDEVWQSWMLEEEDEEEEEEEGEEDDDFDVPLS